MHQSLVSLWHLIFFLAVADVALQEELERDARVLAERAATVADIEATCHALS